MKRLLILTCVGSLAFALTAGAADQSNNNPPKKNKGNSNAAAAVQKGPVVHTNTQLRLQHSSSTAPFRTQSNVTLHNNRTHVNLSNQQTTNVRLSTQANVHRLHTNVAITNNWKGQQFSGQRYSAFRNFHHESHPRDWWRSRHSRIVFYFGAPYYWDAGYWYPAEGYNPGFTYDYDGPIASYGGLPPDQVLVAVQTRLQEEGYYHDAVDGTMGPNTRQALADFQTDHGLAVTAAVDGPTLETMHLT